MRGNKNPTQRGSREERGSEWTGNKGKWTAPVIWEAEAGGKAD